MNTSPGKRSVYTLNYDQMKGKKSIDIDAYSVDSGSVWNNTQMPGEMIKGVFAPVNDAVQASDVSPEMRERVMDWVNSLTKEAFLGEMADPKNVDNYVGNLYYFCEDVFAVFVQAVNEAPPQFPPVFKAAVGKYKPA